MWLFWAFDGTILLVDWFGQSQAEAIAWVIGLAGSGAIVQFFANDLNES
jgi:hypothetical protein